jgi:hypothetical protein
MAQIRILSQDQFDADAENMRIVQFNQTSHTTIQWATLRYNGGKLLCVKLVAKDGSEKYFAAQLASNHEHNQQVIYALRAEALFWSYLLSNRSQPPVVNCSDQNVARCPVTIRNSPVVEAITR